MFKHVSSSGKPAMHHPVLASHMMLVYLCAIENLHIQADQLPAQQTHWSQVLRGAGPGKGGHAAAAGCSYNQPDLC